MDDKETPKKPPVEQTPKADVTNRMFASSSQPAQASKSAAPPGAVQECAKCGHKVSLRYGEFCPQCGTVSF